MADDMAQHIVELRGRVNDLERRADNNDEIISKLTDDVGEIKVTLGQVAKTADLDKAINGLLKSALDAVPGKVMIYVSVITALILFGELMLAFYK